MNNGVKFSDEEQLFMIGIDMDISQMLASLARMRKARVRSEYRESLSDLGGWLASIKQEIKELRARQ